MEALAFLDFACCFFEAVNGGAIIADLVAWSMSRDNRMAIRKAKQRGEEPPPPSKWTTAFQIMTPMVITFTILMIVRWVRRLA